MSPQSSIGKTEAERLQDLAVLLATICRKASLQAEANPAAAELVELARRAEQLVGELSQLHSADASCTSST